MTVSQTELRSARSLLMGKTTSACTVQSADANRDGSLSVEDLVRAANARAQGCASSVAPAGLRGAVIDGATCRPLNGAKVELWPWPPPSVGPTWAWPGPTTPTPSPTAAYSTDSFDPYIPEPTPINFAFDATAHACNASVANALIAEGWYRVRISKPGYEPVITYRYVREDEPVESFSAASCNHLSGATADTLSFTSFPDITPGPSTPTPTPREVLPDIVIDLRDTEFGRKVECVDMPSSFADQTALRSGIGSANVGQGRLHLDQRFVLPSGGTTPTPRVYQRIFANAGSGYRDVDLPGAAFEFHPGHNHIHLNDWATMKLVSDDAACLDPVSRPTECIAATAAKISYCIEDGKLFDAAVGTAELYPSQCLGTLQGISPGWKDVYGAGTPGQFFDIASVPEGKYWVEAAIDPDGHLIDPATGRLTEQTRSNNFGRSSSFLLAASSCLIRPAGWTCAHPTPTPGELPCVKLDCSDIDPACCYPLEVEAGGGDRAQRCLFCKQYFCHINAGSPACLGVGSFDDPTFCLPTSTPTPAPTRTKTPTP